MFVNLRGQSRIRARSACWSAALALGWCLLTAVSAHSHATLLHTEPVANTNLGDTPGKISLLFNERVEPVFNSIRVVDSQGRRVDRGEPRQADQGDTVEIDLQPLADGPYAVLWRINSADGHQVQGHFGFGVRAEAPAEKDLPSLLTTTRSSFWSYYSPSVKWLDLTALVIWLGGIFFVLGALLPALRVGRQDGNAELGQAIARPVAGALCAAACIYLFTEFLALLGQTVVLADVSLREALAPSVLGVVLTKTNYGTWWEIRMAAALLLLVLSIWRFRPAPLARTLSDLNRSSASWEFAAAALLGSVILLSVPMTGHASSSPEYAAIAVASDWLHLAATAIWMGGLASLALVVPRLKKAGVEGRDVLSAAAARFSNVAKVCVLILLATGVYAAWLHLPSWSSFLTTNYGRVLSAKLILLIPILVIGAVNLKRVVPALRQRSIGADLSGTWSDKFRPLLKAEATLGFAILALVAVLTSLPPANAVTVAGPVTMAQRQGNFTVALTLDPNKAGKNNVAVSLTGPDGQPVSGAKRVTLYVRSLDMDMGLETVQAAPSQDGTYQGYRGEITLSMAGKWLLSVEVSPPEGDTFVTEFRTTATL